MLGKMRKAQASTSKHGEAETFFENVGDCNVGAIGKFRHPAESSGTCHSLYELGQGT